jgi:hypothetical protein
MTADAAPQAVDAAVVTQAVGDAAMATVYAPSIHDTQPWRWRMTGEVLDLHLERDRLLPGTDPDSRLAILSCGAALHHVAVSLAADGWRAIVVREPDRGDPDHLARVRLDGRIPVEPEVLRRLQSIALRETDRRLVLGVPIDTDKLRTIAAAVTSGGALLHQLRSGQVDDLAAAAGQARRTEAADIEWQAERAYWTGGGGGPAARDHTAIFAILYGPRDRRLDWLRAGEALSAGWLTATELDVSVLPLSATIEVAGTREHLRWLLPRPGHPYLVLRFGALDPAVEPIADMN